MSDGEEERRVRHEGRSAGKREGFDRMVRTVMGCMAIFRLPMTECEL